MVKKKNRRVQTLWEHEGIAKEKLEKLILRCPECDSVKVGLSKTSAICYTCKEEFPKPPHDRYIKLNSIRGDPTKEQFCRRCKTRYRNIGRELRYCMFCLGRLTMLRSR